MDVPLLELDTGRVAMIKQVEGGYGFEKRLTSLGIRVGQTVRKVGSGPFKGPVVVEVNRAKVAIGKRMAMKVLVRSCECENTLDGKSQCGQKCPVFSSDRY